VLPKVVIIGVDFPSDVMFMLPEMFSKQLLSVTFTTELHNVQSQTGEQV
jgi:hypothetical protein